MSPGLQVIAPGLHSTIQDLGRRGYQDIGVPLSGAIDRIGFRLANALVGNVANAPTLEILVQGPLLEIAAASVRVSLVGVGDGFVIEGEHARTVPTGNGFTSRSSANRSSSGTLHKLAVGLDTVATSRRPSALAAMDMYCSNPKLTRREVLRSARRLCGSRAADRRPPAGSRARGRRAAGADAGPSL